MQIHNILSELIPSDSAPGGTELPNNSDQPWSQEDLSTFLAQLELAFSQSGQEIEDALPWSTIQISEEGTLIDQSGNPLPIMQLLSGQSLPSPVTASSLKQAITPISTSTDLPLPQSGQQPASEDPTRLLMKMVTSDEQTRPPLQASGQAIGHAIAQAVPNQLSTDKADFLSNLYTMRVTGSEVSTPAVMPELPSIAVTALDQTDMATHLPSTLSALQQMVAPTTHNTLIQLPAIGVPVGERAWGENLSQRIQWMVQKEIQGAEVKLNPRGLGPIEIRVTLQNDQASVSFMAHHAVTREALDATIHRLREMFNESNINLANVDVGDRNSSSFKNMAQSGSEDGANGETENDAVTIFGQSEQDEPAGVQLVSNGILDDYA